MDVRNSIAIGKTVFNREKQLLTGKLNLELNKIIVIYGVQSCMLARRGHYKRRRQIG